MTDPIRDAGDATILIVQHALVECLTLQSRDESRNTGEHVTPGHVLDKALKMYLEKHGGVEAVAYLHELSTAGR